MAEGVSEINQAIDARDEGMLMPALTNPSASIHGVTSQCIQKYLDKLANLKDNKKQAGWCLNCLLTLNSRKVNCMQMYLIQDAFYVTSGI